MTQQIVRIQDEWFKHAVFYQVLVDTFEDSTGSGFGDFVGLASRLDYLEWLGIDCIWISPFFESPQNDGGYDVSNFRQVRPELGTLEEFRAFVDQVHGRGMKVIGDLPLNHTSIEHPWFLESRKNPDGPFGDYYVWSEKPDKYLAARIIFLDTEASNWSWDEVRGEYYWHRFFWHQPDLNFDNERVVQEILDVVRFWLAFGMDGFRLDAVPYLIEREGTNCENLPGTHHILKRIRALVDEEFPGRMLLCEANQWPEDVVEYFGDDDECHMAYHFPMMPRIFMGLKQNSCKELSDILSKTPPIPPGCQWSIFLRNHDELTLEMVTEEQREYMWAEYAPEERMRSNLGIRRRLAPLLDNDPQKIRMVTALLLSMPGSPMLYYGDEIGMGDNIWLPDRDGVRTPMQWDDSFNAGFSTAEELIRPVISDPDYAPQQVNVAAQLEDGNSLLHFVRNLLLIRRTAAPLTQGNFRDLTTDYRVFSFVRDHENEIFLCLFNFSDETVSYHQVFDKNSDLLGPYEGLLGESKLTAEPYRITSGGQFATTIPPHGFDWISFSKG